ncbi:MAG: hypothetical protein HY000_30070 [Planctomycetes bacterium]|nr:hypothetical protein [Planctomycetota bacterium]
MQQLIVDNSLRSKLGSLAEFSEVRDERGRLLGHFVPLGQVVAVSEPGQCPFSDHEIAQLRGQTGGRSLAEIWQDLEHRG